AGRIYQLTRKLARAPRKMTRAAFLERFARGALDLGLIGDLQPYFDHVGLSRDRLAAITDEGGLVRGPEALSRLWELIDALDHDGSPDSVDVSEAVPVEQADQPAPATMAGLAVGLCQLLYRAEGA
ncbi:unnamed protein product, partial [marine sediment metagenome]